jgi:hypothetical protein
MGGLNVGYCLPVMMQGVSQSKFVDHNSEIKPSEVVKCFNNKNSLLLALSPFVDHTTVRMNDLYICSLLNFEMRSMLYKLWDT